MRPYLTAAEVAQIELQLAGLASLLEFGCGEATIVAARQVRRIVSVESDPARLRTVQEKVAREAVEFIPVHIDIGPVGEGGYPAGEGRIRDWPRNHAQVRSEEHTSELQSLMRISYAVFCLKKK